MRIENYICQRNLKGGFCYFKSDTHDVYSSIAVYVFMKRKTSWKGISLEYIKNKLPLGANDTLIYRKLRSILSDLQSKELIKVYLGNYFTGDKSIFDLKPKYKFNIKVSKPKSNYFIVNKRVFNICHEIGIKEMLMYLVLFKNNYGYNLRIKDNVADVKLSYLSKVTLIKHRKTIGEILDRLEEESYIVKLNCYAYNGNNQYYVIDAGLDKSERDRIKYTILAKHY